MKATFPKLCHPVQDRKRILDFELRLLQALQKPIQRTANARGLLPEAENNMIIDAIWLAKKRDGAREAGDMQGKTLKSCLAEGRKSKVKALFVAGPCPS